MKKTNKKSVLSLILMTVLIAAMTLMIGCGKKAAPSVNANGAKILGTGKTVVEVNVVDADKNVTAFEVHTDKDNVGDALLEVELVAGDDSEYGLYVKTVNGITADWDVDGTYWAFYINGEYAMTGVSDTPVEEGANYTFQVE